MNEFIMTAMDIIHQRFRVTEYVGVDLLQYVFLFGCAAVRRNENNIGTVDMTAAKRFDRLHFSLDLKTEHDRFDLLFQQLAHKISS